MSYLDVRKQVANPPLKVRGFITKSTIRVLY